MKYLSYASSYCSCTPITYLSLTVTDNISSLSRLSVRDPAIKERLITEPIKANVAKFLAVYERTMEEFEKDVDVLRKAFESRMDSN